MRVFWQIRRGRQRPSVSSHEANALNAARFFSFLAAWSRHCLACASLVAARTDRNFASERRQAAGIIGKGWREAFEAIKGHERFLADLKTHCSS